VSTCHAAQSKRRSTITGSGGVAEHKNQPAIQIQVQSPFLTFVIKLVVSLLDPPDLIRLASTCHAVAKHLLRTPLDFYNSPCFEYQGVQRVVMACQRHWKVVGLALVLACQENWLGTLPPKLTRLRLEYLLDSGDTSEATQLGSLVQRCKSIHTLVLQNTALPIDLTPLVSLANLQTLKLSHCPGIRDASILSHCTALRSLHLHRCQELLNVSDLEQCQFLHTLKIVCCYRFYTLDGLGACAELRSLDLSRSMSLSSLAPLASCVRLQTLNISCISCISSIRDLDHSGLEVLRFCDLRTLNLSYSYWLTSLEGLRSCVGLETVIVSGCDHLKSLTGLGDCVALHTLEAMGNHRLSDVTALRTCTSLCTLDLSDNRRLRTLQGLAGCVNLTSLNVSRCRKLTNINALAKCILLHAVDIRNCQRLDDVTVLDDSVSLRVLLSGLVSMY
jgi:hypothetical protein